MGNDYRYKDTLKLSHGLTDDLMCDESQSNQYSDLCNLQHAARRYHMHSKRSALQLAGR